MLRFDPGLNRIQNSRSFQVFDGGGEYNVAKNLAYCYRKTTAVITALVSNALGHLAEDFIRQGGVDTSEIIWCSSNQNGLTLRNGLYFIERGFGVRPPDSVFDREFTAISQLKISDIDWQKIFFEKGTRWFHTGGIFTALSENTPKVALEAIRIARESGTIVSYDLNYRDSLWKNRGGLEAANELNRNILPFTDVVFGVFDFDSRLSIFNEDAFRQSVEKMFQQFPNIKIIASTLRNVQSANRHDLSGICCTRSELFKAKEYLDIEVFDRVGSGDAFSSGFIYGMLEDKGISYAVDCGVAHAILVMTTSGDNSVCTMEEVENLMKNGSLIAKR